MEVTGTRQEEPVPSTSRVLTVVVLKKGPTTRFRNVLKFSIDNRTRTRIQLRLRMNSVLPKVLLASTRLPSLIRSSRSCLFSSDKVTQFSVASSCRTMAPKVEWVHFIDPQGLIPGYATFTQPVQKSLQDDREYRIIQLKNGLIATIVHDPTADKAAASLNVSVGHLSDPVSRSQLHLSY